jgi:hypothetical protein
VSVVVGLLAGLMLAVMPAASPAYADQVEDQAAKEVATARCEQIVQAIPLLPRKWSEQCASKLAADLASGTAKATGWLHDTCKTWVPDLPLIGDPCDKLADLLTGAYDQFQKRVGDLRATANAVLNPVDTLLSNFSTTIADGLKSLMRKVMTEMVHISSPNLASKGFLSTYAAGAGIGMFVLVIMVARVFYRAAAGDMTGEELADSMWRWVPTAMLLVAFGPALGYLLTQLVNAASVGIIEYFAADVAALAGKLEKMVVVGDASLIPGGPLVSIVIMVVALIGVIGLLGGLLVQLLALYLTGAVMAIAFVLLIDPQTRPKAMKVPATWIGLSLAKPMLLFMVGAVARFADSAFSTQAIKDDGMRALVTALVAALALFVMGVAPWTLLKFAPSLPVGSGDRFAKASRGQSSGALGNMASSTMMQLSYRRMQGSPGGGEDSSPAPSPHTPNGASSGSDAPQRGAAQQSTGSGTATGTTGAGATTNPAGAQSGGGSASSGAGVSAPAGPGGVAGGGSGAAGGGVGASGTGASGAGAAGAGAAGGGAGGAASGAAAGGAAAGATAATGGVAAAALIGVQAADAAKRKSEDVAHRASDTAGE